MKTAVKPIFSTQIPFVNPAKASGSYLGNHLIENHLKTVGILEAALAPGSTPQNPPPHSSACRGAFVVDDPGISGFTLPTG